jgi:uncharacterized membrane protein YagU involved in acid resistance
MTTAAAMPSSRKPNPLSAILWGGFIAGVLDLTAAFVTWGIKGVNPITIAQSIASGLLGKGAFQGGMGTAALGVVLHFLIACSAAAIFYAISRPLTFLTQHAVQWGLTYGIAVYMVMYWIVIPLSAFPKSPHPPSVSSVVIGVLTHMFCVGLPIALSVARAPSPA